MFYSKVMGCLFRNGCRKYSDDLYNNVRLIRMIDAVHKILIQISGYSSLSPDCKLLAVAMQDGYDIHHVETRVPLEFIPHGVKGPGPVTFLHGGLALLGASSNGEVSLWGSEDGERLQSMRQNGWLFYAWRADSALICQR